MYRLNFKTISRRSVINSRNTSNRFTKIFIHTSNKRVLIRIYEELLKLKDKSTELQNGARVWTTNLYKKNPKGNYTY